MIHERAFSLLLGMKLKGCPNGFTWKRKEVVSFRLTLQKCPLMQTTLSVVVLDTYCMLSFTLRLVGKGKCKLFHTLIGVPVLSYLMA